MFARPVYTPSQGEEGSLETEEPPITYIFSEQEKPCPWTVLDTWTGGQAPS